MAQLLDMATSDVHVPGTDTIARHNISAEKRRGLPASKFGDPTSRKYPIDTAPRVRNAAARLEQQKSSMDPAKYRMIRGRIARAAKKFGIDSEYNRPKGKQGKGLQMAITHADGTRTEIRHMDAAFSEKTGSVFTFSRLRAEDAAEGKPVWIQLAQPGSYRGHAQGPFRLDDAVFDAIIANFRANPDGRTAIDFEHASELPPNEGSVPVTGAPAQGWIIDLKKQGGNLLALVEWGELARQYIREGQYRYISPAIRFRSKDRVTGEERGPRLSSAALTNDPFLKGMRPLAASHGAAELLSTKGAMAFAASEYMPAIRAALRMPSLCSGAECMTMLSQLRDYLDAVDGDHTAIHEGIELSNYLMPLRDLVGARPGSTWDQILDTVEDMIGAAIDRHEVAEHANMSHEGDEDEPTTDGETPDDDEAMNMTTPKQPATTTPVTPAAPAAQTPPAAAPAAPAAGPAGDPPPDQATLKQDGTYAALMLKYRTVEQKNRELEAENTELREKLELQTEEQISNDVFMAFETYKEKKNLTDKDRDGWMLRNRRNDPESFREQFPPVAPTQQHLLKTFTSDGRSPTSSGPAPRAREDAPPVRPHEVNLSAKQLARKIARERRIPLGQAQILAKQQIANVRRTG